MVRDLYNAGPCDQNLLFRSIITTWLTHLFGLEFKNAPKLKLIGNVRHLGEEPSYGDRNWNTYITSRGTPPPGNNQLLTAELSRLQSLSAAIFEIRLMSEAPHPCIGDSLSTATRLYQVIYWGVGQDMTKCHEFFPVDTIHCLLRTAIKN